MFKSLRLSIGEIFLLQVVLWLGMWLANEYIATLLTLCIGAVVFAVLLIAMIAEFIERSKVPRQYFYIMGVSLAAIVAGAGLHWLITSML